MSQPFDNRDWDIHQLQEKDQEIERLKAVLADHADAYDAVLLKAARDQGAALDTIESALNRIVQLKALCARAAEALEGKPVYDAGANMKLIAELREAAQ